MNVTCRQAWARTYVTASMSNKWDTTSWPSSHPIVGTGTGNKKAGNNTGGGMLVGMGGGPSLLLHMGTKEGKHCSQHTDSHMAIHCNCRNIRHGNAGRWGGA